MCSKSSVDMGLLVQLVCARLDLLFVLLPSVLGTRLGMIEFECRSSGSHDHDRIS